MFGLGIFTYLKIGLITVALAIGGYYVWSYHHMKTKVATLEAEIGGLKLRADIIEKAQKATEEYQKKMTAIQRKVAGEKAKVDQVVESGDNDSMKKLFIEQGLLMPDSISPR